MPEGPSIVILKEEVKKFAGKKILTATGNTTVDLTGVAGSKVVEFLSWGKLPHRPAEKDDSHPLPALRLL
jgi:endonuclease-8